MFSINYIICMQKCTSARNDESKRRSCSTNERRAQSSPDATEKIMQNTTLNWCAFSWVHLHTSLCSLRIYEYETAGIGSWCIVESDHKLWIVKTAKRNYVVHIPKWIFRVFCCHCRSDINTVHCICCIPSNSGTINTLHEPAEKWQHFCWCQRSKRQPTESEVKWTVWTIHNVFWASATRWNHKTINCINNYRFCHCCYTFNSMQIANFIFYI